MLSPDLIDQLTQRLEQLLPAGSNRLAGELRQNIRTLLQESMSRLDLVSREEFETQSLVLARTREKLEAMEAQIQALEQLLTETSGTPE